MDLAHGELLPPLCIECGADTDRTKRLSRSLHKATSAESTMSIPMGWLLGPLFARLMGIGWVYVTVDLPLPGRVTSRSPRPARVSFEERTMTRVVHRAFEARLTEARATGRR